MCGCVRACERESRGVKSNAICKGRYCCVFNLLSSPPPASIPQTNRGDALGWARRHREQSNLTRTRTFLLSPSERKTTELAPPAGCVSQSSYRRVHKVPSNPLLSSIFYKNTHQPDESETKHSLQINGCGQMVWALRGAFYVERWFQFQIMKRAELEEAQRRPSL